MDNLMKSAGVANPGGMEHASKGDSEYKEEIVFDTSDEIDSPEVEFKHKRVTKNFYETLTAGNSAKSWMDWKKRVRDEKITMVLDKRNNIYCVSPTYGYDMYYFYITYLNSCKKYWVNNGYLDMGMVPYIMWPSFMEQSEAMEQMKSVAIKAGVDLIDVPSMSFLKSSYRQALKDSWIFREDLHKIMQMLNETYGFEMYSCKEPTDASLSMFLKPLAAVYVGLKQEV